MATSPSTDTVNSAPSIVKGMLHHTTHDPNVVVGDGDELAGAIRYKPCRSRNCPGRDDTHPTGPYCGGSYAIGDEDESV
eukprot:scaffold20685_cov41-Attheya_sp.AAC.3